MAEDQGDDATAQVQRELARQAAADLEILRGLVLLGHHGSLPEEREMAILRAAA